MRKKDKNERWERKIRMKDKKEKIIIELEINPIPALYRYWPNKESIPLVSILIQNFCSIHFNW
jgi:hypothetical protein